jgi:hypothetical protein
VGADLNDTTTGYDGNEIGVTNCGEAMSNNDGSALVLGHDVVEGFLHHKLRLTIQRYNDKTMVRSRSGKQRLATQRKASTNLPDVASSSKRIEGLPTITRAMAMRCF